MADTNEEGGPYLPGPNGERCCNCDHWELIDDNVGFCCAAPPSMQYLPRAGGDHMMHAAKTGANNHCRVYFTPALKVKTLTPDLKG